MGFLKTLILIATQLNAYSNAIDFDEGCFIGEKSFLQLAIAIDRTVTFIDGSSNSFYDQFANLAPTLMEEIDKDYPGSEFAATNHGDWEYAARPPVGGPGAHTEAEGCYTRLVEFTTDRKLFQTKFRKTKVLGNGKQENGLSALAFTAADSKLGWIRNATAANGRPVRRVLLLVTDEDDLLNLERPNDPKPRHDFKGDGNDTCRTSKPPTHKILREVFEKYQMTVIALLAVTKARLKVEALYKAHFEKIGDSIRYCGRPFVLKSRSKGVLFTDMKSNFKVPKGFWSGEDIITEGETNISRQDMKQQETEQPTAKAGQYDALVKFVKDCLRETDDGGRCLYGDPEGFNTLGF